MKLFRWSPILLIALLLAACMQPTPLAPTSDDALSPQTIGNGNLWRFFGQNLNNTRNASTEHKIGPANAPHSQ